MDSRRAPLAIRFHAKYRIDSASGCWLWTASKNAGGYGTISVKRRPHGAHRVSYELHIGAIPDGLFVLHSCDIPACVNPAHLRVGTVLDNARDAVERGRIATGLRNGLRRLWPEAVSHIRQREMKGYEYAVLYGVSPATITGVLHNRVWKHAS